MLPLAWVPIVFARPVATPSPARWEASSSDLLPGTSGWLQLAESAGRSGGLFLVGAGTARAIDLATMIDLVAFGTLLAGLVLLALPRDRTARAGGNQRGPLSAGDSSTWTAASAKGSAARSP